MQYYSKGFIAQYGEVYSFDVPKRCQHIRDNGFYDKYYFYYYSDEIAIYFYYAEFAFDSGCVQCSSLGEAYAIYDSLANKHHDTTFFDLANACDCCYSFDGNYGFDHRSTTADINSIVVTSNEDWDSSHPAETPLNDLIIFTGYTPVPFIRSGYNSSIAECSKISKPLHKMLPKDYELVLYKKRNISLKFISPPDEPKSHHITVHISMDDGRDFSVDFFMEPDGTK